MDIWTIESTAYGAVADCTRCYQTSQNGVDEAQPIALETAKSIARSKHRLISKPKPRHLTSACVTKPSRPNHRVGHQKSRVISAVHPSAPLEVDHLSSAPAMLVSVYHTDSNMTA